MSNDSRRRQLPLTLAVLFYNQESYAEAATRAALGQSYSPLEIVLSDDASTDKTYEVVSAVAAAYNGPHTVILNRNAINLGIAGHVNAVFDMSSGEYVLLAGGDDLSMPDRARETARILDRHPTLAAVSFDASVFHGDGPPTDLERADPVCVRRYSLESLLADPRLHLNGASRAVSRRVFEDFGPIALDCPTEDSVMLMRSLLSGYVVHSTSPQVHYRVHDKNVSIAGRHRIAYSAIYRQYAADIETALAQGRLTQEKSAQLQASLRRRSSNQERRAIQSRLIVDGAPWRLLTSAIAFHRSLTFPDTLRLLGWSVRRLGRLIIGGIARGMGLRSAR